MVVLAPLSSLTLPSGRAKPLVRGEVDGDPAALSPPQGVSQESGLLVIVPATCGLYRRCRWHLVALSPLSADLLLARYVYRRSYL